MRERPLHKGQRVCCLTIALACAAAGGLFTSCATEKPRTALVEDPDSQSESSIPWNRPEKWESGAQFPGGIGSGFGSGAIDPTNPY